MKTPLNTHRRSGIYAIECTVTRKVYIGSAVNLAARIRCHRFDLRTRRHHNRYLQRAFLKYGLSAFTVRVVEYCEPQDLIKREQFYIDRLRRLRSEGFNLNPTAGSSLGLKRTKENCERMRQCRLGKPLKESTKRKLSRILKRICKGKKVPRSMIEKAALFNRGRPLSEAHANKIGDALRGRKRPRGMMNQLANFNRGKKRKPETISKMRAAALLYWKNKRNEKSKT